MCKQSHENVFEQSQEGVSGGVLEFHPPQEQMYWEKWCDCVDTQSHPCIGLAAEWLAFVKFQVLADAFPKAELAKMYPQSRYI